MRVVVGTGFTVLLVAHGLPCEIDIGLASTFISHVVNFSYDVYICLIHL